MITRSQYNYVRRQSNYIWTFTRKSLEQTINCLVDVFTSAEPIFTALKITPSEYYPVAEIICQKAKE